MDVSHFLALVPALVLMFFGVLFYRKVIMFASIVIYTGTVAWVAYFGHWEGLVFAAIIPVALVGFIGLATSALKGEIY
jgi:hypothetical protein